MIVDDFDFLSWNIIFNFIILFSTGCGIVSRKRKRSTLRLDLNVDLDSDSIMPRLASE